MLEVAMPIQSHASKFRRVLAAGLVIMVAGCGTDGLLGSNQGRIRVILASEDGGSAALAAPDPEANASQGGPGGAWSFTSATVTLSSILARTHGGVLVNIGADLPVAVDVAKIDGGRSVQLPDGVLPAATYDQVVLVITAVQGVASDGTVVTVEPPGGGWTTVVPICPLDVAEGETATVGITLNVRGSFLRTSTRWSFQPRFRSQLDCSDDDAWRPSDACEITARPPRTTHRAALQRPVHPSAGHRHQPEGTVRPRLLPTLIPGENLLPPVRPFLRRCRLDARGDCPDVPGRIHEPGSAISPELILERDQDPCPTRGGAFHGCINVRYVDEDEDRRRTVGRRRSAGQRRPF
jgi:hypothetical protein